MPRRPAIPTYFIQSTLSGILDWWYQNGFNVLRILHLHPVAQVLRRFRRNRESPKVALYHDRRIAFLSIFLHIVPLTSVIILMILNLKTTNFGNVSTSITTALQFLAKWLEVLTQSSLAAMLLDTVRRQVLGPSAIPFGAFLAPYRLTDISYLCSLEYWGLVRTLRLSKLYRMFLCVGLTLAVLLASVIGPSIAVAIVPRNLELSIWKEVVLLDPRVGLFPQKVDLVSGVIRYVITPRFHAKLKVASGTKSTSTYRCTSSVIWVPQSPIAGARVSGNK
jgi:hypothetical protein